MSFPSERLLAEIRIGLGRSPQRLAEERIFLCFPKASRLPKAFGIAGMTAYKRKLFSGFKFAT